MNQSGTLTFYELTLMKQLKQTELIFPFTAILKYTNIWSPFPCGTNTSQANKASVTSTFKHTAPVWYGLMMNTGLHSTHTHTSISGDASESKEKSGMVLKGFASSVNQ